VYAYTFESNRTDDAEHAHGVDKMDPGGGGTFYFHNVNRDYRPPAFSSPQQKRSGTIAITIVSEEADGGLVLRVREDATDAAATTCVTFGDTSVVCDPAREVSPEAAQLVALLGKNFVDPARLDSAKHWRIEPRSENGATADYTILRSDAAQLEIEEKGVQSEKEATSKETVAARIGYDSARSLPTSLDESTTQQTLRGSVRVTITTHTTLQLTGTSP